MLNKASPQSEPTILCMTATLIEAAEKKTLKILGMVDHVHRVQMSPISPRITLVNSTGKLNFDYVASMVNRYKDRCPRILVFEDTLVDCGAHYTEIEHVSLSKHKSIKLNCPPGLPNY